MDLFILKLLFSILHLHSMKPLWKKWDSLPSLVSTAYNWSEENSKALMGHRFKRVG